MSADAAARRALTDLRILAWVEYPDDPAAQLLFYLSAAAAYLNGRIRGAVAIAEIRAAADERARERAA